MRNITLRPGESIAIGDTVITIADRASEAPNTQIPGYLQQVPSVQLGEGAVSNGTFSAPDDLRPILNEILRTGIRKADVARRLGVERATITDASRPSDRPWMPTYANGVRLMQLHREVCGGEGGDA